MAKIAILDFLCAQKCVRKAIFGESRKSRKFQKIFKFLKFLINFLQKFFFFFFLIYNKIKGGNLGFKKA